MSTENAKPAINSFKVKGNWSIQTGKEAELLKKVGKRLNKSLEETTAILEKDMH